jgi:hypothetical protein
MKGALIAHVGLWTHDLDSAVIFSQRCYGAAVSEPCRSGRRPGFVSRFVNLPVNYRANLSSFDHRSQSSQPGTAEDQRNQFSHRLYVALPIVIKPLPNCSNDRDNSHEAPLSNDLADLARELGFSQSLSRIRQTEVREHVPSAFFSHDRWFFHFPYSCLPAYRVPAFAHDA